MSVDASAVPNLVVGDGRPATRRTLNARFNRLATTQADGKTLCSEGGLFRPRSLSSGRAGASRPEPVSVPFPNRTMSRSLLGTLPLALLLLAACDEAPLDTSRLDGASAAASATVTVAMRDLNNPRGLAFGPEGGLYVAEAGTNVVNGPCTPIARGENCYSGTGSVSRLWRGRQERTVTGLPSRFNPTTGDIGGPHDVAFQGRGNQYVSIGWGADPALRAALGDLGAYFGTLIRLTPNGRWAVAADISGFEQAHNPAGGPVDSNPYGVLAEGGRTFVADAGGNSLLEVGANGDVSLVAVFAPIPVPPGPFNPPFTQSDAVPTEVKRGPDGALYVSMLTGVPFLPGAAAVYRVVPGQAPQVRAGGFTAIIDFDWGPDGSLYVVQYASAPFLNGPGSLVRVAPDGSRTVLAGGLAHPTGVAVGPDGAVYVSNRGGVGDAPGTGEVLRILP